MSSKPSVTSLSGVEGLDECCRPEFIYGGPFIKVQKVEPFMTTATPMNLVLQGTFKKSFAYYSLKERLPIILTKVIDYCSRQGAKIKSANSGATDEDIRIYMQNAVKLKSDLLTNKPYDLLQAETEDAKKWNTWIEGVDCPRYFTNTWVFTECYVYRRLRDGGEITKGLGNVDPFDEQKEQSFTSSLETMCIVAEKVLEMLPESDKDKRKNDFMTLLKICLWANRCDLALTAGEQVNLSGPTEASSKEGPAKGTSVQQLEPPLDPFQMIIDLKDKLLVDDTAKIADQVVARSEALAKTIEGNTTFKFQCSCHRLATSFGMPLCKETAQAVPSKTSVKGSAAGSPPPEGEEEEEPKIPCPAKMVVPQSLLFDIVCDNAGYELFSDLCLAHFLVSQKIVQKIRFHVKKMPWFVSDVTQRDFKYLIDACTKASFNRTVQAEPKPEPKEGEPAAEPEAPRVISAEALKTLGTQWKDLVDDGTFIVMDEEYWTWPHCYKDMKTYDYNLYRKLQYAVAILFKGDLNYRKLLGEKNWNPVTGFEPALQGFIPAPIIAARTVKADLICGLPKGRAEALTKIDEKWMETGEYGVIQFCPKAEPLKPSDRPCIDYGDTCFGGPCPLHADM